MNYWKLKNIFSFSRMIRCTFSKLCISLILCTCITLVYILNGSKYHVKFKNYAAGDIIDFTYADNVTGYPYNIVPNIAHFVIFDNRDLSFIQGKYWDMVRNISSIEVLYMDKPTHIFERPLSSIYHSSDIARLKILMKYGGIFLDTDTYVIKPLDYFRKFEMALGWPPGQNLGTQLLVAHKNARFLKLWYNSYRYYRRERWYYNAGELPTSLILERMPYLVHRVPYDFGVHNLVPLLYGTRNSEWKNFHSIHLLVRHKNYLLPGDSVLEFNEDNIKSYNKTFGDMARLVLYGTTNIV